MAPVVIGEKGRTRHVAERVVDHPDIDAGPPCLGLGEAGGTHLGVGEDDLGHGPVVSRSSVPAPGRRVEVPLTRAAMASPHTRPWYLPWWVRRARWLTSPAAYSQPPSTPCTARVSSTSSQLPGTKPMVPSPMSSVRGRRPAATRSSSPYTSPVLRRTVTVPSPGRSTLWADCPVASMPDSVMACSTSLPATASLVWEQPVRHLDDGHVAAQAGERLSHLAAHDATTEHDQPAWHVLGAGGVPGATTVWLAPARSGGRATSRSMATTTA